MNKWDGNERRNTPTDHDTLIEMVQIMRNQTETAKVIASNLKDHEMKDQTNFDGIRKDILGLQKIVWTATGIIIALDAIPKVADIIHIIK